MMYSIKDKNVIWYDPITTKQGAYTKPEITYYINFKGQVVTKNPYVGKESALEQEARKDYLGHK